MLTLNSTGNTVGQERYFAFGSVRFASGTMQTDRLYTGQRNVASLGLLDYRARFYDPYLNRFISPDSVIPSYANPQSLDRYSYVLNSPIGFSDPSGMKPCWATARYSCNLKKVTKNQANAIVAQYKPSEQAAVVSFFRSQGVPVSDLKNTHGLIERAAPSDAQLDSADSSTGTGKPLLDPLPMSGGLPTLHCASPWLDCALSVAGLIASGVETATLGAPEIAAGAAAVNLVITIVSVARTKISYSEGQISDTRRWALDITAVGGLIPIIGPGMALGNVLFTWTGLPR